MMSVFLLILISAILLFLGYSYFEMRRKQASAKNAMIELQSQLVNRLKLAPEIYTFVKESGYTEKDMLVRLKKSVILFKKAKTTKQLTEAGEYMDMVMERLNHISKQNPELASNPGYTEICSKIIVLDEKIAFAKTFYKNSLQSYNNLVKKNPTKIVANIFNFKTIDPG